MPWPDNADTNGEPYDHEKVIAQLMEDYGLELKRIAYLYINDLTECEDIIQEVFINCYHQLENFRFESNIKTWLIRITINKCKDYHRLWRVKKLIYSPFSSSEKNDTSAEEHYLEEETSSEILSKIAMLSPKYKEVLILYYYQEMTMQEISDVLSIGINTVKSRLLRGKRTLQTQLERMIDHGQI